MVKRFIITILAMLTILSPAGSILAAPYGSGPYGDCGYSESCATTNPPTTPPATPPETTPAENTNPTPSPVNTTSQPTKTYNSPPSKERSITADNFGGATYEKIGDIAKKIPKPVAYGFPYLLLLLILLLIVRLIWQTRHEIARLRLVLAITEREKELEQEKRNFLMLTSHYLRTPITVIKANVELAQSLKSVPESALPSLQAAVTALLTEVNSLLTKLSENKGLEQITVSEVAPHPWRKTLLSPFVMGPIVFVVTLLLFVNFIFADFRVTQPRLIDILVQIVLIIVLAQWLVSSVRRRHLNRQNRIDQQRVLDERRELELARGEFISEAAQGLTSLVDSLKQKLNTLQANGTDVSRIRKGVDLLQDTVNRFLFAAKLQALSIQASKQPIDVAALMQDVVQRAEAKAEDKKVMVESIVKGGEVRQNLDMLGMVIDSLVDNAIKYSNDQGTVSVSQEIIGDSAHFSIQDQGQGMTPEQLNSLFKAFSRAESAETFNTEGLGLSLYLDRLIMHYLGGEITLRSIPNQGTNVQVSLPRA